MLNVLTLHTSIYPDGSSQQSKEDHSAAPLATTFNADFGDQRMAVRAAEQCCHPGSAALLILASHNIPTRRTMHRHPTFTDMVLGLYYITKGKKSADTHGKSSVEKAELSIR